MTETIDINDYLNQGVKRLVGNITKAAFGNPRAAMFMLGMQNTARSAQKKREKHEREGIHIPAFLISSITEKCNLFCHGCYARSNGICSSGKESEQALSATEWGKIFADAVDSGILFNILAGGEPLLRKDVITVAGEQKKMIFGIFTNSTLIDDDYVGLLKKNPNLVPILSMEGFEQETDQRRGAGIYSKLNAVMKRLKAENIIYGASVTVTSANFETITSIRFIDGLRELGCKLIFFIEYVPVEKGTEHLALSESQKVDLENVILRHKQAFKDMIFISFPGDEKFMGGCLAAGRGFFHINPQGDAEACPFSPYSDRNLKDHTLFEVLRSPFFEKLRDAELVGGEHTGGCALFEHEEEVRQLLNSKTGNV